MNTTVFFDFPLPVQITIVVWGLAHILLAIWALIRLFNDKHSHIMGLSKIAWAVIIFFVQVFGSIFFLIMHSKEQRNRHQVRSYEQSQENSHKRTTSSSSSVVEDLYRK